MKRLYISVFVMLLLTGEVQAQRNSEKLDKLKQTLTAKIGGTCLVGLTNP